MSRTTAVVSSAFADVDAEADHEIDHEIDREIDLEIGDEVDLQTECEAHEGEEPEAAEESVDDSLIELTTDMSSDDLLVKSPADGDAPPASAASRTPGAVTKMGEMSDEELLKGIRSQSEVHFAELYNRYFQRIYSFVYTRMRNHAETEEVVQETFLAVFRSFEHYRGQSSLLSWIYGIAKNSANNSIRRARSQNERIELADEEDLAPRPSLGVGTPGEQLDLHRFQDQLAFRLDGLADWQTEIFEMRHFENLSIPEISRRTTRSSDAVRSSLYRVKRIFFEAAEASGASASMMVGEQS